MQYRSNFTKDRFEGAVARAKEYIQAGDIFQVVLSQRLQAETRARPFDIYRALRVINASRAAAAGATSNAGLVAPRTPVVVATSV